MANDDIKEPTFIEHETGDTSQPVSVIVSDAMISGKAFRDASVEKLIDRVFRPLLAKMKPRIDEGVDTAGAVGPRRAGG